MTCRSTACAVSTDHGPADGYRLAPSLALRREAFGGIAYSYATRRLRLIWSPLGVEVALLLNEGASVADVSDWLAAGDTGRGPQGARLLASAIEQLVAAGILVPAEGPAPAAPSLP